MFQHFMLRLSLFLSLSLPFFLLRSVALAHLLWLARQQLLRVVTAAQDLCSHRQYCWHGPRTRRAHSRLCEAREGDASCEQVLLCLAPTVRSSLSVAYLAGRVLQRKKHAVRLDHTQRGGLPWVSNRPLCENPPRQGRRLRGYASRECLSRFTSSGLISSASTVNASYVSR